jgi:hypothetical protein
MCVCDDDDERPTRAPAGAEIVSGGGEIFVDGPAAAVRFEGAQQTRHSYDSYYRYYIPIEPARRV